MESQKKAANRVNKMVKLDRYLYASEGKKGRINYYLRPGMSGYPEYIKIGRCELYSNEDLTASIQKMLSELKKNSETERIKLVKENAKSKNLAKRSETNLVAFKDINEANHFIANLVFKINEIYASRPTLMETTRLNWEAHIVTWIKLMTPLSLEQILALRHINPGMEGQYQPINFVISSTKSLPVPRTIQDLLSERLMLGHPDALIFQELASLEKGEAEIRIHLCTSKLTSSNHYRIERLDDFFRQFAKKHSHFNEQFINYYVQYPKTNGEICSSVDFLGFIQIQLWWEEMVRNYLLKVPAREGQNKNFRKVFLPWDR